MPFEIAFDDERSIVEVCITGELNIATSREIVEATFRFAKAQNSVRILTDMHGARVNMTTADMFNLPTVTAEIAASVGLNIHSLKRAFLASEGMENPRFAENVKVNRYHQVRYFDDSHAARTWLCGG